MAKLAEISGIGGVYAKQLGEQGIPTTEALLEKGSTPKGRKDVAAAAGISEALVLKWVNRADLARIKGVGEQYADLLEAAGVDTVPELAQRKPDNLHHKIAEVNAAKRLVRRLPSPGMVKNWVEQAKQLPRVVKY